MSITHAIVGLVKLKNIIDRLIERLIDRKIDRKIDRNQCITYRSAPIASAVRRVS